VSGGLEQEYAAARRHQYREHRPSDPLEHLQKEEKEISKAQYQKEGRREDLKGSREELTEGTRGRSTVESTVGAGAAHHADAIDDGSAAGLEALLVCRLPL
jgi:hypothetical protein